MVPSAPFEEDPWRVDAEMGINGGALYPKIVSLGIRNPKQGVANFLSHTETLFRHDNLLCRHIHITGFASRNGTVQGDTGGTSRAIRPETRIFSMSAWFFSSIISWNIGLSFGLPSSA